MSGQDKIPGQKAKLKNQVKNGQTLVKCDKTTDESREKQLIKSEIFYDFLNVDMISSSCAGHQKRTLPLNREI